MKRLIVCCDGTWQKLSNRYPTNVVKIAQAIKLQAEDNHTQIVFYDEGVGTGDKLDRFAGGAFGWGIDRNIQDAYRFLCFNYNPGDEIYLYGFSRGAYTVRSLAGLIYCSGLLSRTKIRQAKAAYDLYRDPDIKPQDPEAINFRAQNGDRVPIKLLGCWDTVGSLGIPDQIPILPFDQWINEKYQFHNTSLSPIIENARHAVAIDECRKVFDVTPMTTNLTNQLRQVWFPGDHSAVGGGTKQHQGLSDGALQWMIEESKSLGLDFDEQAVINGVKPEPTIPFKVDLTFNFGNIKLREVSNNFEDLHSSVIERWSSVKNYRPQNLDIHQARLDTESQTLLAQRNIPLPT